MTDNNGKSEKIGRLDGKLEILVKELYSIKSEMQGINNKMENVNSCIKQIEIKVAGISAGISIVVGIVFYLFRNII